MGHCCYINLLVIIFAASVAGACQPIFVDQSGGGSFTSIQSPADSVPAGNKNWVCIYINAATYNEKVTIPEKGYIYLKGAGVKKSIVKFSDRGGELADVATLRVYGENVVAKSIAFINSYNYPWKNGNPRAPAPAVFVGGDKVSFYVCAFFVLQDTLYDDNGRHYFKNCLILGIVDFIFGAGQSIYEGCTISVGQAVSGPGYITAQGRDRPNSPSGFVFVGCKGSTFLGRPWRQYARVLFYKSSTSSIVVPAAWTPWGERYKDTAYSEYQCTGPGSDKSHRVPWMVELSDSDAHKLADRKIFIDYDNWIENQPS